MKSILAGVLLFVGVAFAYESVCQSPQQFSAKFSTFVYSISKMQPTRLYTGTILYDSTNIRLRIDMLDRYGKPFTLFQFFKEGKQYYISGDKCYTMPVQGDFQKVQIPENATLADEGRLGIPPNSIQINRYYGQLHGANFMATVARDLDKCILGSSVEHKGDTITYVSLINTMLGIDDEKFEKPKDCSPLGAHAALRRRRSTGGILDNPENMDIY